MIKSGSLNNPLKERGGESLFGKVKIDEILKKQETPFYLYDTGFIREKYDSLLAAMDYPDVKVFYAMKANPNPAVLRALLEAGSGIDAVSIAEVKLALALGFPETRIIFTANNITDEEMEEAVECGVLINIGSLSRLEKFCRAFPGGRCCLRFNPDVEAGEDKKIQTGGKSTKFGILLTEAGRAAEMVGAAGVKVVGLHKHTGSGISDTALFLKSMGNLLSAAAFFPDLAFVDIGGGFKVPYREEEVPVDYKVFGKALGSLFTRFCTGYGRLLSLYMEPGKYLTAESGILVVKVNTMKENRGRKIAGTDSGFPHLIRPTLYGAYHAIANLSNPLGEGQVYDICGNICESGDRFAEQRTVPEIREEDYLAILNAGAYCASMASTYNLRSVPAELIVDGRAWRTARRGLSADELVERILSESGLLEGSEGRG